MKKTKYLWIVHVLFVIYMGVLFRLTLFRSTPQREVNWHLFREHIRLLQHHSWWHFVYFFGGNIAAFIPFGAYLGFREKKIITTVIFGFLLSLFIESMQYVWSVGISEIDDLILNTLGAFLGVVAVKVLKSYCSDRT